MWPTRHPAGIMIATHACRPTPTPAIWRGAYNDEAPTSIATVNPNEQLHIQVSRSSSLFDQLYCGVLGYRVVLVTRLAYRGSMSSRVVTLRHDEGVWNLSNKQLCLVDGDSAEMQAPPEWPRANRGLASYLSWFLREPDSLAD
ncbi:hypothetical protein G7K_2286-t1 [Saitoella complicata NRRL Y-17804]|uniref:Uncharacterized protein n=1 Tax=Saitoella complicata (strain BCRC 22490 / CBS 7301 / JCM 7358 / NBRC 10748 / NRRL Y-17804) TaxID=698492 RepID=A0A0E9NE25_SAICN|nr:hypothetical protein G7K_2286-t1 [Saitoella complicata NRRL Y-17804]